MYMMLIIFDILSTVAPECEIRYEVSFSVLTIGNNPHSNLLSVSVSPFVTNAKHYLS